MGKPVAPRPYRSIFGSSSLLPLLVLGILSSFVGILYWNLERNEVTGLKERTAMEARYLASDLKADIDSRILALLRVAKEWEARGGIPKQEFLDDATRYMADTPGFQALE